MTKSIEKRIEELEAKTAHRFQPPKVIHTGEPLSESEWEAIAIQHMRNMKRLGSQMKQMAQGEGG